MRIDVPLRLRNTNKQPEKGSARSFSWHNCASESMPFLPSTASIANQDAHLRRNLDHARSHNARLSPARSGAVVPFHWIRILPCGPSNSMRHSARPPVWGATSSINAGAAVFAIGLADCTIRLSLPYSKRKTFAVWNTPCSRATAAADAHSGSGIGKRAPLCALRQRSKRRYTLRIPWGISAGPVAIVSPPCPRWADRLTLAGRVRSSHAGLPQTHVALASTVALGLTQIFLFSSSFDMRANHLLASLVVDAVARHARADDDLDDASEKARRSKMRYERRQ